jgi:hypothetical protein
MPSLAGEKYENHCHAGYLDNRHNSGSTDPIGFPLLWLAATSARIIYNELILVCALGAYCAVLLVIAIATLVTVWKLYRKLAADDAADDVLLDRQVRRVQREIIDSLHEGRP